MGNNNIPVPLGLKSYIEKQLREEGLSEDLIRERLIQWEADYVEIIQHMEDSYTGNN